MRLAYNGTAFHGWQTQPGGVVTVQQTLENALSTVLRRPTAIVGAGRTDTGVHARAMIAHFDSADDISALLHNLPRAIGSITGPDIAISSIWEVQPDMHARFSATSRTYRYFALTQRSPFFYQMAWTAPKTLDFEAMNAAASHLLSVSDFTSFAKLHSDTKTNICHVTKARWSCADKTIPGLWIFEITADRFLRNMVRAVVGTLVDVGRGKLSLSGFDNVISSRNRCAAGTSMPAHALYLWDVSY